MLWKPGEVRLVPGGRKQITHCTTHAHTHSHTSASVNAHMCRHLHTAAQLWLNGVSSLTYFFTVTLRLGTLELYVYSAIKLLPWCECLGSRGGSNHKVDPPVFPVVRQCRQKEAPFCRVEVLTALSSHLVRVRESNEQKWEAEIRLTSVLEVPLKVWMWPYLLQLNTFSVWPAWPQNNRDYLCLLPALSHSFYTENV